MFSRLLPEVISDHIFSFLHVNDLLRLRRVCKASKKLSDDYLRVYGTSERVIEININESSDELTNFLVLTYPVNLTRFYLTNTFNWGREEMLRFLGLHGDKITHLHVSGLHIPIVNPAAIQFFEGLTNLKELKIDYLCSNDNAMFGEQGPEDEEPLPDLNLPSTFQRLKHLHVGDPWCRPRLAFKFFDECSTNLELVDYPFRCSDHALERVRRIVERRHRDNPGAPNVQYVDLERFRHVGTHEYARRFYELVTTCSAHGVKLQNVDARLIEAMMELDTPDRGLHGYKISRCLAAIKNLTRSVFRLELPLLEAIAITGTFQCSMPEADFQRQSWGNLKQLKIQVNSESLEASRLLQFFFHGIRRENLESLELHFDPSEDEDDILHYPEITNVCSSCPNLKKLLIDKWPGTDEDIAQLWGNLPLLEDVTLEDCESLGDAAFIGDDVTRPAIFNAKRLKSLTLKQMSGITDTLFQSALRHMPLKNFYLQSLSWISLFTLAGLESLLTGKFAETIEKFPLKGRIDLEDVTDEQLAELEGKFRSAQMNTFFFRYRLVWNLSGSH